MKIRKEDLPVIMEAPGSTMRSISIGGITMNFNELSKGTDFTPLLRGLKNDLCHCPHWGYIQEGKILLKYGDEKEETATAGDLFYWPAGHTAIVLEDAKFIEFSPEKEYAKVITHVTKIIAQMEAK